MPLLGNLKFSKPHMYKGGKQSLELVLKAKSIYKHCHACIFNCACSCRLDCISISSSSAVCFITPRPVTLWGFLVRSMTNVYSTTSASSSPQCRSPKDTNRVGMSEKCSDKYLHGCLQLPLLPIFSIFGKHMKLFLSRLTKGTICVS